MRQRLNPQQRKLEILKHAKMLFHKRGFTDVEMSDICKTSGISRGGLYHHFGNKGAILHAIVAEEVGQLANEIEHSDIAPIEMLLENGSSQLGNEPGIVTTLKTTDEKLAYLSSFDVAVGQILHPVLASKLAETVCTDVDADHVAELFLTINAHMNKRLFLGDWSELQGAAFAVTALKALVPFFKDATRLRQIIQKFQNMSLKK